MSTQLQTVKTAVDCQDNSRLSTKLQTVSDMTLPSNNVILSYMLCIWEEEGYGNLLFDFSLKVPVFQHFSE